MIADPRLAVIDARLKGVQRIVAVTGGKGGIGKSLVASTLAVSLARSGRRVGLLDLDMTGPCDHLILDIPAAFPEEPFGVEPPRHHGISFMSVSLFSGASPVPLRGPDITDALVELLAITRWGELDVLIIDMPPGLGDATLDAVRLIGRAEYLVVTTPSIVVRETVRRTLQLLRRTGARILGVVENMSSGVGTDDPGDTNAEILAREVEVPFLGSLRHDPEIESSLGRVEALLATGFAKEIAMLALRIDGSIDGS